MSKSDQPAGVALTDQLGAGAEARPKMEYRGIAVEKDVHCLHPEVKDGQASFFVYAANTCDEDLDDTLIEWLESENEVSISWKFSLPFVVEDAIEMHRLVMRPGCVISADAKPLFEAMRRDLAAMVERIDALSFE